MENEPIISKNSKDIEENKLLAAIGYLGILCLIPLLAKKDSAFCQFHGKQGLVIFIVWIVLSFINILPFIGQIIWLLGSLVLAVLVVMGMIHALNGEEWEVPVLGQYAKQIKL
ncbi:MAG: hypothetical protein UX09_C0017G0009 [Candidatus Uhrbacteria bacterium GW2011_GWE2_45_35]|uniref:Chloroplast import component protein (Tic20) n=2 Tax=Candidatus Uhriibacteriota TaxID=1752732 RepID=A0A0G1JJX1_9BACT|nr:MAG: hypothetical protein UW63_C0011G0009 [Candidatus Uhrbacteria bacterium GW2011_GWF2_44_350]KKU08451.1 MAG: hypothetical protein UX09_C0017G0009 [Candidatus Uhrbacteria bacterium GW2011_GWE2_45_35]HBR80792.1 hypothetical protein [Candidatus Uhrbacteria bacterium]